MDDFFSTGPCNLARHLDGFAKAFPSKPAVIYPAARDAQGRVAYTHLTFSQLAREVDCFAAGFRRLGVRPGMRVMLMVRPGLDFLPLTFSLFRIGAVPVLIDPGMGGRNLLRCAAQAEAEVFVGIPLAHVIRVCFPRSFRRLRFLLTIGRRYGWGGWTLDDLRQAGRNGGDGSLYPTAPTDQAAIIFTTGSTGPPKGVIYTHRMFEAQRNLLQQAFDIGENDVDMPGFILFAIFSLAMGMSVTIPDMDPTRPAHVVPQRILEAVENGGASFSFGSPALWARVAEYCVPRKLRLPSMKRVIMAGAPVPAELHRKLLHHMLPEDARVFTPYGATEALPVTCIEGKEVLAETLEKTRNGRGVCVGRPLPGVAVKIIEIRDEPIVEFAQVREVEAGEVGEIIVQGPNVSPEYFNLPAQTAQHKIYEKGGTFWHRIGDVGYFDTKGRLWFCGRKTHRVVTADGVLFSVCCEAITNEHPAVRRSALVGTGADRTNQVPVLIVELQAGCRATAAFFAELRALTAAQEITRGITHFLVHPNFPVDIRHNAKIFREKLRVWAEKRVP